MAIAILPWPALASDWTFQITPYAWMTGLSGTIGAGSDAVPVDVDLSFRDILDDLDAGAMLFASARNGPWVVQLDATFTRLSSNEDLRGALLSEAAIESRARTLSLAVGRSVLANDEATVDAYAGVRAWWLDNDIRIRAVDGRERRSEQSETWIDPIVGVSGVWRPNENWTVFAGVEAGGFGLAADREVSAFAGVSYAFGDHFAATAGWRHLAVDYRTDDLLFDVTQSGPILGATFRF